VSFLSRIPFSIPFIHIVPAKFPSVLMKMTLNPVDIFMGTRPLMGNSTTDDRKFLASSGSGTIAAFMFIEDKKAHLISNPKGFMDDDGNHIIIGQRGNNLETIEPISIRASQFENYTYGFLPHTVILDLRHELVDHVAAAEKSGNSFVGDNDRLPSIPLYPGGEAAHLAFIPTMIPLPFGHGIDIDEKGLELHKIQSLDHIHPWLDLWLTSMRVVESDYMGSLYLYGGFVTYCSHQRCVALPFVPDDVNGRNVATLIDTDLYGLPENRGDINPLPFSPFIDTPATVLCPFSFAGKAVIAELEEVQDRQFAIWYEANHEAIMDEYPSLKKLLDPARWYDETNLPAILEENPKLKKIFDQDQA